MANYKSKELQDKINILMDKNYNVLQVTEPDGGDSLFFIVQSFEPPQTNSVSSSPFLSFKGIEFSEFLGNNVYNQALDDNFILAFDTFLKKNREYFYKFSDKYSWVSYTKI